MNQDDQSIRQPDGLPEDGQQALEALRGIWSAKKQTSADIDESCGNTKSCKNMANVGFHGWAEDADEATPGNQPVGNNVRTAWKSRLEREGKLSTQGRSVRDLVFGSPDPNQK